MQIKRYRNAMAMEKGEVSETGTFLELKEINRDLCVVYVNDKGEIKYCSYMDVLMTEAVGSGSASEVEELQTLVDAKSAEVAELQSFIAERDNKIAALSTPVKAAAAKAKVVKPAGKSGVTK